MMTMAIVAKMTMMRLVHLSNIRYRYRAGLAKGISGGPPLLLVLNKMGMMLMNTKCL